MPEIEVLKNTAVNQTLLTAMEAALTETETARDDAQTIVTDGTAAVDALVTEAETAQAAAEAAQTGAETAETNAGASATASAASATAAATSATNAATSETNAAASATAAEDDRQAIQSSLANINQTNAPAALRSALAIGAEVVNQWPDAGIITKPASVTQAEDGSWTLPDDTYLWLDIPTAPAEAANVSFGFVVLEGDGRFVTATATAGGASSTVAAVPVETDTQGEPPLAFLAEGSGLDFGGTNLVIKITNPLGNGEIRISKPVLQYAPRIIAPFDLAGTQAKIRPVKTVAASATLQKADSGKIIKIPASTVGAFTLTTPAVEGWWATIINNSSIVVTVAASGGTVRGNSKLATQYTSGDVYRTGADLQTRGDFTT